MTLTLRYNKEGRLLTAEVLRETAAEKRSALLTVEGTKARLRRGGSAYGSP
jgi:hypothetical protein